MRLLIAPLPLGRPLAIGLLFKHKNHHILLPRLPFPFESKPLLPLQRQLKNTRKDRRHLPHCLPDPVRREARP